MNEQSQVEPNGTVEGEQRPAREAPQPAPTSGEPAEAEVQSELNELMDRLKRVTADYQNYQKRVVREMVEARKFANAELVKELLIVMDDLERALAAGAEADQASPLLEGVRITYDRFKALLARQGVQAIQAQGKPFDPEQHEAMMRQPTDQAPPMTVLTELTRGYSMHGRTLRPARVVVAAAPEKAPEKSSEQT